MTAAVRVLLADDHAVMRAGFRMILESSPGITVVGEAATGAQAVAEASRLRPDVICMDVQMPDMDGLEATRRITADPVSTSSIVIVTTFDRDDYLFQALAAGASGFLLKNAGPEELITAVRVAAAGDALLAPAVTKRVIERFALGADASPAEHSPAGYSRVQLPAASPAADAAGTRKETAMSNHSISRWAAIVAVGVAAVSLAGCTKKRNWTFARTKNYTR